MIDLQFSESLSHDATLRRLLRPQRLRRWAAQALESAHEAHQITLRVVDEAEGRQLNRHYRGRAKNYATNVLTFDYQHQPFVVADVVLCAPVIAREAQAQGKDLQAHWAHLVIHGLLHAQGYEHEHDERDALEMEALEVLLMQSLGYPNPY
jgi:probable rRNA maturation factor